MIFLHFFMYFLNFYASPAKSPVTTAPTLNSITPQAMTAGDVPRSGIFPNMATGDAASSPKIAQYKLLTTGRDKLADLAQIIISKDYKRVMVFCNTKYNTGMLANQLARLHFNVDCLHGDLSQAERNRIMQRFKAGEINVLVATDVAARGIDVSDVDAVINYDVPEENEHYTHRIGRTGRAKREGASYLFYTKDEQKRVDTLLRLTRNTDDCRSVHFDFNHEKLVVEEKQNVDKFNIKCYF